MELMKPHLALYMGGMGAEDTNFHADVYRRMGYSEVVDDVTTLFRTDRKDEAAKVIPDELVDDSAIVGNLDYVRKQIVGVGGRGRHDDGGRRPVAASRSGISPRWCRHFLQVV